MQNTTAATRKPTTTGPQGDHSTETDRAVEQADSAELRATNYTPSGLLRSEFADMLEDLGANRLQRGVDVEASDETVDADHEAEQARIAAAAAARVKENEEALARILAAKARRGGRLNRVSSFRRKPKGTAGAQSPSKAAKPKAKRAAGRSRSMLGRLKGSINLSGRASSAEFNSGVDAQAAKTGGAVRFIGGTQRKLTQLLADSGSASGASASAGQPAEQSTETRSDWVMDVTGSSKLDALYPRNEFLITSLADFERVLEIYNLEEPHEEPQPTIIFSLSSSIPRDELREISTFLDAYPTSSDASELKRRYPHFDFDIEVNL